MWNDLRYTLRMLRKNYAFTLLCASVLALGLGILLPEYALLYNLGFRTPDFPEGERFVALRKQITPGSEGNASSTHDAFHYRYFKENSTSFAELHVWRDQAYTISEGNSSQVYSGAEIEPALLEMPQVQAERGRLFNDGDVQIGASPVVIISHDVWQVYYGGRDDIIGVSGRISGETRTIVGVMPVGYSFPLSQDIWLPLALPATIDAGAGEENLRIIGKLKEKASRTQANTEVGLLQAAVVERATAEYPDIATSIVVPYIQMLGVLNPTAPVLFFTCMLLLLAFNVGNLFLTRGEERLAELALRSAVGASAARVGWALLLESFFVCCGGLAGGWLLGYFATISFGGLLETLMETNSISYARMFWWDMNLNGDMLATSAAAVLLIWLASGGVAAWQLSRTNLGELLAAGGKGHDFQRVTRFSKILVNLQLVIGCVLLTYGIVFAATFGSGNLIRTPDADHLFLGTIRFGDSPLREPAQQQQYLDELSQGLAREPGVQHVAFTSATPGTGGPRASYNVEDQDQNAGGGYPEVHVLSISSNYFDVLSLPLNEGRNFASNDTRSSLPVVIIDQRLASRHWPNTGVIGKRIQLNPGLDATWYTVVGVSKPIVQEGVLNSGLQGRAVIYRPTSQQITGTMQVVVRMDSPVSTPAALFRSGAARVNRDVPVTDALTLQQLENRNENVQLQLRNVAMVFVFIALYVTGIATYGLASRVAGRRRIETGVRMSLGASYAQSLGVFVADGFKTVVVGLGFGGVLSVLLTYALLTVTGKLSFGLLIPSVLSISAILGVLVMLANYIPARRIIAMEPADALRYE